MAALLLLTACSPGTEGARLGETPAGPNLPGSTGGPAQPELPPIGASLTCRTAPEQLTRDWNRILVARHRDYFPARLTLFTHDVDQLTHLSPSCPGHDALPALTRIAARLHSPVSANYTVDKKTLLAVAAAGNRWLTAQNARTRFAPP
jgi:hypothetical protein